MDNFRLSLANEHSLINFYQIGRPKKTTTCTYIVALVQISMGWSSVELKVWNESFKKISRFQTTQKSASNENLFEAFIATKQKALQLKILTNKKHDQRSR